MEVSKENKYMSLFTNWDDLKVFSYDTKKTDNNG